jgi:hypothetical protein
LGVLVTSKKDKPKKGIKKSSRRSFRRGSEDLEQLKGIEAEQQRSRVVRRKREQAAGEQPTEEIPPLIERINKSKDRLRNRLDRIKDYQDALDEFGS